MQITNVYYEKVFPIAPYVNEKIGVTISILPGESPQQAFDDAKEWVNNWGYKMMEPEPTSSRFASHPPYGVPVMPTTIEPHRVEEEDKQFDAFKDVIEKMETREDAEEYTRNSEYKYSIEAKQLIDKKFPKP